MRFKTRNPRENPRVRVLNLVKTVWHVLSNLQTDLKPLKLFPVIWNESVDLPLLIEAVVKYTGLWRTKAFRLPYNVISLRGLVQVSLDYGTEGPWFNPTLSNCLTFSKLSWDVLEFTWKKLMFNLGNLELNCYEIYHSDRWKSDIPVGIIR